MSEEHLSIGSVCPPATEGVLRCYSMKFCPYAQRVRIVLTAKGIKHEIVNINLSKKPEWFAEKNPLQKVPALESDGKIMFESLITADYLDEAFPDPPLHRKDPWLKGQDRIFLELFSKVSSPMYKLYSAHAKGEKEEMAKIYDDIQNNLEVFEEELSKRETKFFGGDNPGMSDYMMWPWGERLSAVELMIGQSLPQIRFPKMKSWMRDMKEDEVVKAVYTPPEIHKKFLEGAFAGNADYDMEF